VNALFQALKAQIAQAGAKLAQLKAMVYGTESLPALLREQLSDVTVVTSKMFKNLLNLAGERISALVTEVQAQFALARSA
jgi:hypothetical protein